MAKRFGIFYSALLLTGVNLLLRLVSTSFQVYISGKIGAAGVGLLQLTLSVAGMATVAASAGIRTATMYLTAAQLGIHRRENVSRILWVCGIYALVCSCTVAGILWYICPMIVQLWIGDIRVLGAIRTVCVFLPVSCLCGVMSGYFTAAGRIPTLAAVEVAEQACSMAVTVCALVFWAEDDPGRACQAVVLGSSMGACVTLGLLVLLRSLERAPKGKPFPIARELLDTAVPLALADDLKAGISTAENLMVPKRLALYPKASAPLALFGTVCGMVFPVMMFPAAIVYSLCDLLIPEMARCYASQRFSRIRYLGGKSLKIVFLYSLIFSGLFSLLAGPVCMWLYQSSEAGMHLGRYALLIPMLYCDAIIDAMNKGLGQQKICVRYNILTAAMDILFLFLLLPRYGMDGYFFSFLLSHLVNFLLSLRLLVKTARLHLPWGIALCSGICAAAAVLIAGVLPETFWRLPAFILVFFSLLTLSGVINRNDLRWMKRIVINA